MRKRSVLIKGIPERLLRAFDKKIEDEQEFPDRSECIRDLMRKFVFPPSSPNNNRAIRTPEVLATH